jgi:metal-sulfur cluster biosynthetic enzyme
MAPLTEEQVRAALREVLDPELGISIADLGLIYDVIVDGDRVRVDLTMTTPACPLGDLLMEQARGVLLELPGVRDADVRLVWEPPWSPERVAPSTRELLGWR